MPISKPTPPQTDNPRVLVFDSGVGGLSICQEIITASPAINLDYLSDNAAFPYGEKTAEKLIERATALLSHCYQLLHADLIVIACNTASTVVLPSLRKILDIPIVGVVPAIKTAAQISQTKTFALLATPGTVKRSYTQELIQQYAANCKVLSVGSSELVRHIESYIHGAAIDKDYIASIVAQLCELDEQQKIDTVVLGCTHFPLIANYFRAIKPDWQWIDSGNAIASRVQSILADNPNNNKINGSERLHNFWLTADTTLAASSNRQDQHQQRDKLDSYLAHLGFAPSKLLPTMDKQS